MAESSPSPDISNWKPHQRGQPASNVNGVPDEATVWACFEKIASNSTPTTVTVYRSAPNERDYVALHRDSGLVEVTAFDKSHRAVKHADELLREHGSG